MTVILKIKYMEELRNSIEWMKDKCQENPAEISINTQTIKNCDIEEGR